MMDKDLDPDTERVLRSALLGYLNIPNTINVALLADRDEKQEMLRRVEEQLAELHHHMLHSEVGAHNQVAHKIRAIITETFDRTFCGSCHNEVDADTCHCGMAKGDHHPMTDGHAFIPIGCTCGYWKPQFEHPKACQLCGLAPGSPDCCTRLGQGVPNDR